MRKIIAFFIMGVVCCMSRAGATLYIDSIITGENLDLYQDAVVSEQSIIDVDKINITDTVFFENRGTIYSDILLCDSCDLLLRNSGSMYGKIYLQDGSNLTQLIKSHDDINRLDVKGGGFSILVQSDSILHLSDIVFIASGADKVILDNSMILVNSANITGFSNRTNQRIELVGEITLEIENLSLFKNKPILSNVYGDGVINIRSSNLDPLYVASTIIEEGNVYLNINREMDYQKIMGDSIGDFINQLRVVSPNNSTLLAMDKADSMSGLKSIMDKSVMFNPGNLTHPIQMFNRFEINTPLKIFDNEKQELDTVYFFGQGLSLVAGKTNVFLPTRDFDLSVSLYGGYLNNTDKLNKFSGSIYGGNINGKFNYKSMWMHVTAGLNVSKFETDVIFYENKTSKDPRGFSFYSFTDFGTKFNLNDNFYIQPFVGFGYELDNILHQSEVLFFSRIGAVSGFEYFMLGIKYDYQIFAVAHDDKNNSAGIRMNFWSVADDAGLNIEYAINKYENEIFHKLSFGIKFKF